MRLARRILKIFILVVFLFLALFLYLRIFKTDAWICPRTEHAFLNEKYDVETCKGGYTNENPYYSVRIRIYSKNSELLGQREFSVWTEPMSERIDYLEDKIIYHHAIIDIDNGVPEIVTKNLQFPLTKWDWFEANLDRILFSP